MIVKNEQDQYLQCLLCGEVTELTRRTLADPEKVLLMMEHLTDDHADCAEFAENPKMAALERGYKVRMRELTAGSKRGRHGRT